MTDHVEEFRAWAERVDQEGRTSQFTRQGGLHLARFLKDIGWPTDAGRKRFNRNEGLKSVRAEWEVKYCDVDTRPSEGAARLRALIAECAAKGETLPLKNGALYHAEIIRQARLGDDQITNNEEIRNICYKHAEQHNLAFSRMGAVAPEEGVLVEQHVSNGMVPVALLREAKKQLGYADKKLALLRSENASLRAQLLRADEVAELIAIGGRITPGRIK